MKTPKPPTPKVRVTFTPPPPLPWTPTEASCDELYQTIERMAVLALLEAQQLRGNNVPSLADYPQFPCGCLTLTTKEQMLRVDGGGEATKVPPMTIVIATGPLVQEDIKRAIKRREAKSEKGLDWELVDPPAPAKKTRKKKEVQS